MQQDRGDRKAEQSRRATLAERWRGAQPTKTAAMWLCLASAVLTMIVGFAWGGWVTEGTAQKMAEATADAAVVKRLAPICVVQFKQDPAKVAKLVALKGTQTWEQDAYIEKQGWATIPGEEKSDRKVAEACAALLLPANQ